MDGKVTNAQLQKHILETFGNIWRHSKTFWYIRRLSETFGDIRRYSETFEDIRRHSETFPVSPENMSHGPEDFKRKATEELFFLKSRKAASQLPNRKFISHINFWNFAIFFSRPWLRFTTQVFDSSLEHFCKSHHWLCACLTMLDLLSDLSFFIFYRVSMKISTQNSSCSTLENVHKLCLFNDFCDKMTWRVPIKFIIPHDS